MNKHAIALITLKAKRDASLGRPALRPTGYTDEAWATYRLTYEATRKTLRPNTQGGGS